MRHPSKVSNVARLRAVLNQSEKFDQAAFAELIGCSVHTLVSIELDRLKLSEQLAHRIAQETGVSLRWLLENNLKGPIVSDFGRSPHGRGYQLNAPYTFEDYERAQTAKQSLNLNESEAGDFSEIEGWISAMSIEPKLRAILFSAKKRRRLRLAMWKIGNFLTQCQKQFGFDSKIFKRELRSREAKHRTPIPNIQKKKPASRKKHFARSLKKSSSKPGRLWLVLRGKTRQTG